MEDEISVRIGISLRHSEGTDKRTSGTAMITRTLGVCTTERWAENVTIPVPQGFIASRLPYPVSVPKCERGCVYLFPGNTAAHSDVRV